MDDLKGLAKAPVELFSTFIAEARAIMDEQSPHPGDTLDKFEHARKSFGHEMERLLKELRQKIIEREEGLRAILHPSGQDLSTQAREAIDRLSQVIHRFSLRHEQGRTATRSGSTSLAAHHETRNPRNVATCRAVEARPNGKAEDLVEDGLKALDGLSRSIARFYWTEKITRAWEDQSAAAILANYQAALAAGDTDTIEIFEGEAERVLARKGDPQALATFLTLKAQPLDSRLTPAQRQAKAALEELRRIKEEAALSICLLASVSRFHAGLIPLCTQWRQESRQRVEPRAREGMTLALRKDQEPPLPASVLDWSRSGLKVKCPRTFPPGTVVGLSLHLPQRMQRPIASKAEVRWIQEHPNQPGRFMVGLRILGGEDIPWWELLSQATVRAAESAAS